MTISKKSFLMFVILAATGYSIGLYGSQNKHDSKQPSIPGLFTPFTVISIAACSIGTYIIPTGITRYRLGKELANPKSKLTPESIKKSGLLRIGIGIGAMLPYVGLIGHFKYKTHKVRELGKQRKREELLLPIDKTEDK